MKISINGLILNVNEEERAKYLEPYNRRLSDSFNQKNIKRFFWKIEKKLNFCEKWESNYNSPQKMFMYHKAKDSLPVFGSKNCERHLKILINGENI